MENTTATPEVEFSDRMKETIIENLRPVDNETLALVDNDTVITPNGDRYVGITTTLRYFQCSKTHFYMDISKKNNIREKHWKKRVYFNEVDLIGVANSYKLSKSPDISIERTNSEKEEKRESRQNGPVALIRESYGQQDKLIERINIINERKQLFFGLMMFFISSTLFLGATFFYFSQSVDKENQLNNAEKLKLNDTKTRLEQIIEAKTVENNSLNVKLAVLQEKGNQK